MSIWCMLISATDLIGANLRGNLGRARLDEADLRDADLHQQPRHR